MAELTVTAVLWLKLQYGWLLFTAPNVLISKECTVKPDTQDWNKVVRLERLLPIALQHNNVTAKFSEEICFIFLVPLQ